MKTLAAIACVAIFVAAAPQGSGSGAVILANPTCPTIMPDGTSCMPDETCIRRGGECAITQPVAPIRCKCVV